MKAKKRVRDSVQSRKDILDAAEILFAEKGLYGTRVDDIADKASINKRMIYEYFGCKEELYKAVLVKVYGKLTEKEIGLLSEDISCIEAIRKIIVLYFEFLRDTPTYVNLILWENLNKGKYIEELDLSSVKDAAFEMLRRVIKRGKDEGVFRKEADTEQVILSLLTYTFAYFSNRYTLSKLLSRNLYDEDNTKKRVQSVTEMFLDYLCEKKLVN